MENLDHGYSDDYIEACFFAWYRSGSPGMRTKNGASTVGGGRLMRSLPPNPGGRTPSINTVASWVEKYGWRERADALDAQVSIKLEKEVINERVKTLRELAKGGESLLSKGLAYIEETDKPFEDNPSAAVRAIIAGAEMRFKYAGMADALEGISDMSNKQLEREILNLLGKESGGDEEEILVSESEEVAEDGDTTEDDNS